MAALEELAFCAQTEGGHWKVVRYAGEYVVFSEDYPSFQGRLPLAEMIG